MLTGKEHDDVGNKNNTETKDKENKIPKTESM